jgi:ATP-dependent DNA helicase RecG
LCTSTIAWALSQRFLRNYFAVTGIHVPGIEAARLSGEGQTIEFKRGLSDDDSRAGTADDRLLESIAAFANTNGGVIFIGIDDAGNIKGLDLDFKGKDRLRERIHQLVRNRIKPQPYVQITCEDVHSGLVVKVVVAEGEAPPYMIRGTVYIRVGSADVQAQPDEVVRLVLQHAL